MIRLVQILSLLIICSSCAPSPQIIEELPRVSVQYKGSAVPIGVSSRYEDVAKTVFPKPTVIEPIEAKDKSHSFRTYCWSFEAGTLELSESDFGMFTVVLSQSGLASPCMALASEPSIKVGNQSISLATPSTELTQSNYPEFLQKIEDNEIRLTHSKPTESTCGEIIITATIERGSISKVSVMNWAEPGSC